MSPSQSATSQWGWGFHTVWSGIDPGDLHFRPRVVGFVRARISEANFPNQIDSNRLFLLIDLKFHMIGKK